MTWVSPQYVTTAPVEEWSLDFRIQVFLDRVDGWHLQVAERCINGWEIEGKQCIETILDYRGIQTHQIPHSGWAVLQIVIGYFETIGLFLTGDQFGVDKHRSLFDEGVKAVFPEFNAHIPRLTNVLWNDLRGGLYHSGIVSGSIRIGADLPVAVSYDQLNKTWLINPHIFVTRVRNHFNDYGTLLLDSANQDTRYKFNQAFVEKYLKKQK